MKPTTQKKPIPGAGLASLLAIALAGGSGCGGRTAYGYWGDGGAPPDGSSITDGATQHDGSQWPDSQVRPDGGEPCDDSAQWEPMTVPLDRIEVLNAMWGGGGIPEGISVRIAAELTYTGCDEMAGIRVDVQPFARTVLLTGHVWRYIGNKPCPFLASTGREIFSLPRLSPGDWSVVDYLVNAPGTPFFIRPCGPNEDCFCQGSTPPPVGWGSPCDYDCWCEMPLDCNIEGTTSMGSQCYQTCSVSSDCPPALFCNEGFLPMTPEGLCLTTGLIDACESNSDCPPGHTCRHDSSVGYALCVASMPTQPVGRPCQNDCDCPTGFSCIADPIAFTPTCEIRCRGNRDCPPGTHCDNHDAPAGPGSNLLTCQFLPD